jgi:hypothetical protein
VCSGALRFSFPSQILPQLFQFSFCPPPPPQRPPPKLTPILALHLPTTSYWFLQDLNSTENEVDHFTVAEGIADIGSKPGSFSFPK